MVKSSSDLAVDSLFSNPRAAENPLRFRANVVDLTKTSGQHRAIALDGLPLVESMLEARRLPEARSVDDDGILQVLDRARWKLRQTEAPEREAHDLLRDRQRRVVDGSDDRRERQRR